MWFINGQPLADVEALIADVRRRLRPGPPLRFGLSAFVIARDTAAEAGAVYDHLLRSRPEMLLLGTAEPRRVLRRRPP